jgi:hypothetical protein
VAALDGRPYLTDSQRTGLQPPVARIQPVQRSICQPTSDPTFIIGRCTLRWTRSNVVFRVQEYQPLCMYATLAILLDTTPPRQNVLVAIGQCEVKLIEHQMTGIGCNFRNYIDITNLLLL